MASSPNNLIRKWEWAKLFRKGHDKAFTQSNIKNGFKKCGIYPLDRNALTKLATAPSHPFHRDFMSPSASANVLPEQGPTPPDASATVPPEQGLMPPSVSATVLSEEGAILPTAAAATVPSEQELILPSSSAGTVLTE